MLEIFIWLHICMNDTKPVGAATSAELIFPTELQKSAKASHTLVALHCCFDCCRLARKGWDELPGKTSVLHEPTHKQCHALHKIHCKQLCCCTALIGILHYPLGMAKPVMLCGTPLFQSDPNFYTVDEQGMFTCTICPYQTNRRPNFYKHKKKHLGKWESGNAFLF